MSKITEITLSWKDNTVWFDDTDASTDYFHSYRLTQKATVEWVGRHGADRIHVRVVNNDPNIPAMRRLRKIARDLAYKLEDASGFAGEGNARHMRLQYILTKQPPADPRTEAEKREAKRQADEAAEQAILDSELQLEPCPGKTVAITADLSRVLAGRVGVGTRIYNRGDMANPPHFGTITLEMKDRWGHQYQIHEDGAGHYCVPVAMVHTEDKGHGGTRIITVAAYEAWRQAQLQCLMDSAPRLTAKPESVKCYRCEEQVVEHAEWDGHLVCLDCEEQLINDRQDAERPQDPRHL